MMLWNRIKAAGIAACLCAVLVPCELPAVQAETLDTDTNTIELPEWIPNSADSAVSFLNTHGATYFKDGYICAVTAHSTEEEWGISMSNSLACQELIHKTYTLTDVVQPGYDVDFDVFVCKAAYEGQYDIGIGNGKNSRYYNFLISQSLDITQTDIFGWLPDCATEFSACKKENGLVFMHDNTVVYLAQYVGSAGYDCNVQQSGTGELECFMDVGCSYRSYPSAEKGAASGGTTLQCLVYRGKTDGVSEMKWMIGRSWELDNPISVESTVCKTYRIREEGKTIELYAPDLKPYSVRFQVVDYDTGELIHPYDDEVYTMSIAPYIVMTLDEEQRTGPMINWDWKEQNPYIFDFSQYKDAVQIDIGLAGPPRKIPQGYVLPTDYLLEETYADDCKGITVRLKRDRSALTFDELSSVGEIIMLEKWLTGKTETLKNWEKYDYNEDGVLNVSDLAMMKQSLLAKLNKQ